MIWLSYIRDSPQIYIYIYIDRERERERVRLYLTCKNENSNRNMGIAKYDMKKWNLNLYKIIREGNQNLYKREFQYS